ncbi:hypothetical protein DMI65_21800 [Escherichia coli]|nr:hypothetical protein [Escherichia coli]
MRYFIPRDAAWIAVEVPVLTRASWPQVNQVAPEKDAGQMAALRQAVVASNENHPLRTMRLIIKPKFSHSRVINHALPLKIEMRGHRATNFPRQQQQSWIITSIAKLTKLLIAPLRSRAREIVQRQAGVHL